MEKIFDVRVSRKGEIVDALSVNKATPAQINAVLTLCEVGDEVLFIAKPFEV